MKMSLDERERFRAGMRRVSGTVAVVTTAGPDGSLRGVTATAFCSLSADPPSVLACINRDTWVGQIAPTSGNFCVNVLGGNQQALADVFSGRSGLSGAERFQTGRWRSGLSGAPVLEDSLVSFDCALDRAVDHATHVVLIGRVLETLTGMGPDLPLLYADGQFTIPHRGGLPQPMA